MNGLVEDKTRQALRRKYADLIDTASEADAGEIAEPVAKKPAIEQPVAKKPALQEPVAKKHAHAKATIKRPATEAATRRKVRRHEKGAEPPKKRPATGAATKPFKVNRCSPPTAMKDKKGDDCTAIVPVDDPSARQKDRNKWLFLLRNRNDLDQQVLQMITKANQKEKAVLVNNAVRRGADGNWTFNMDSPIMVEKIEKFHQRYADMYDQGQPYELAESMWGGPEKLKQALKKGLATKVQKDGKMFIKWSGFKVGSIAGVKNAHAVRADAAISGQEAIEFSNFIQSLDFGFVLQKDDRQVMVEWYTINMC